MSLFTDLADRLEKDAEYATDVQSWADTKLGAFMWSTQQTIARLTQERKRVAVYSCNDAGKTYEAALLGCHHIDTHAPKTARLMSTAPSATQVRSLLWNEIGGMWETARDRGSPMQGYVNQTEWWIGRYQAGMGRKPPDQRAEEIFAGFHAQHMLVILDEADGLAGEVWDGIEALMTNEDCRLFAIGNPLNAGSRFSTCIDDPDYATINIPYDQTPNFTGEKVPIILGAKLIQQEWVARQLRIWGEDHPYWYGHVLAQYPPESMATIIMAAYINACMWEDPPPLEGIIQLGVDVAASEDGDRTVVHARQGNQATDAWDIQTADDDAVEEFVVQKVMETRATRVAIDATGFGTFFPGRIRKRCPGVWVIPVNFSAAAEIKNEDTKKSRKYANMRAQLWWETGRELMRQGLINLSRLPEERRTFTIADLTAARYNPEAMAKDLIQVEDKDEIRKRLKRSPDDGDAHLLSFYEPIGIGGEVEPVDLSGFSFPRGATNLGRLRG